MAEDDTLKKADEEIENYFNELYEDSEGNMKQFVLYDNLSEFIQTFEAKKNEKKKTKLKVLDKFLEETVLDEQLPDKL